MPKLRHLPYFVPMTSADAFGAKTYTFGMADRLRVSREHSGMDQREFAERTGISRATISNYERGISKPRWPQIVVWAMATGYDPLWLRDGQAGAVGGAEQLDGVTRGYHLPFHSTGCADNFALAA